MRYFFDYSSCMDKKDGRAVPHAVRQEILQRAVSRELQRRYIKATVSERNVGCFFCRIGGH